MPPESADRLRELTPDPPSALLLGPGTRTAGLEPHLEIFGGRDCASVLDDLADALWEIPSAARLVVDADEVPIEDVGILRRFLAAGPTRELFLLGDEPQSRTARAFSGVKSVRFLVWPLDLEQLSALSEPSRGAPREFRARSAKPGEISEVEALGVAELPPLDATYELPARRARDRAAGSHATTQLVDPLAGGGADRERALATVLQRFEAAFRSVKHAVRDSADVLPSVLACSEELDQLVEWSRAAGRGSATDREVPLAEAASADDAFDLGHLLEEVLAGVAVGGADAPRFLFRSRGDLATRGPRAKLAQGFEGLFLCVRELAEPGTLIQVAARDASGKESPLTVTLNFPAGPLESDDVLRVYHQGGRLGAEDAPELVRLTKRVSELAAQGAGVSFSSESRNRLLLELGFDRELAGQNSASSLAGA